MASKDFNPFQPEVAAACYVPLARSPRVSKLYVVEIKDFPSVPHVSGSRPVIVAVSCPSYA